MGCFDAGLMALELTVQTVICGSTPTEGTAAKWDQLVFGQRATLPASAASDPSPVATLPARCMVRVKKRERPARCRLVSKKQWKVERL